jgi:hypothetical protein
MARLLPILLLGCSLGLWSSSGAAQPDPTGKPVEISDEARRQFGIGVALLDDAAGPRYQEAYEAFHRAYADSPTPKILSNIGLCAMMLERDGEALESVGRYLAEVPGIDPRERSKLEQDLETLGARVAHIELQVSPAKVTVTDQRTPLNGDPIINRYEVSDGKIALGIHGGNHRIEVAAEGHEPSVWQLELEPGKKQARNITLKKKGAAPPKPPPKPTPPPKPAPTTPPDPIEADGGGISTGAIIGLVATGALAISAGVVGGLALNTKGDYESYETGGNREDAEGARAIGETLNIVTDVLIGSAVLSAGITTVLLIIGPGDDPPEAPASGRFRVVPTVGLGGVGAVLETTF